MSGALTQIGALGRRSIVRTLRQPALLAPGIVFPLFLYGFNVGGLDFASQIPGFPDDSFVTFGLALTFAFTGIFAVLVAGTQLGEDIRSGFIRRQSLTALSGSTLLMGNLAGVVAFGTAQAILFLAVGLAAGASVAAGPAGAALIVAFAALYALALGSLGLMAALLLRSGQAVQGIYPLLMGLLFLSSVNLPRELIQTEWFQTVATYNPLSYLVEAPRSLLIEGWDPQPLALGALVALAILFAALLQASLSFRAASVSR